MPISGSHVDNAAKLAIFRQQYSTLHDNTVTIVQALGKNSYDAEWRPQESFRLKDGHLSIHYDEIDATLYVITSNAKHITVFHDRSKPYPETIYDVSGPYDGRVSIVSVNPSLSTRPKHFTFMLK